MSRKLLLAEALYRMGVVHMAAAVRRLLGLGGAIYLMGHRVLPAQVASGDAVDQMALMSSHAITPEELERRLGFVERWIMPAGDPAHLCAAPSPGRRYFLTFDDGYRDNLLYAAPVLARRGVRAVIFFVAALLEKPGANPWWDRFGADALVAEPAIDRAAQTYGRLCTTTKQHTQGLTAQDLVGDGARRYLDEQELQQLPEQFYAANHTRLHANLERLSAAEQADHIAAGDAAVRRCPRYLPLLAYPFGYFNRDTLDWLRRDGRYKLAFATGNGVDGDPLRQRRINLNVPSFSLFAAQCAGLMK